MRGLLSIAIFVFSFHLFGQPSGSLDPSFGSSGKVITNVGGEDKAIGVVMQPDGKILVVGFTFSMSTGKDFLCIRYNSDGSLDNTFASSGIYTLDVQLGSDDVAKSIALQSDGKIVLAGFSDNGFDKNAAIVRLNSDGSIDNTFGTSGIVTTDFESNQQDEINVVKIHALSGNILVGGTSIIDSDHAKPVIARYLNDGTLDVSFNATGIKTLWVTPLDYQYVFQVEDLEVQSSGKISAVGWRDFPGLSWDSDYWACRINSDGTMDNTFSSDGVAVYNGPFNGHDRAFGMILNPDNSIVASGGGYIGTLYYEFTIFQINSSGTASAWGEDVDFNNMLDDISYGLQEDINGKYVMAGSSGNSTSKSFALSRINSDSSIDTGFGTSGKVTTTFSSNQLNECFEIVIQTDNKIVAVGYTGDDIAIARYLGTSQPMLDDFSLISPADLAINQNYSSLILDWTDAFGATSYEVDLALDNMFTLSLQTFTVTPSNKTVTGLLPNTEYFWRVRASDGSTFGNYSVIRSFTTNSLDNFSLTSPVNNSTDLAYNTVNFNWTDAVGAMSYEFEIDSIVSFTYNPQSFVTTSSAYTLTNLEPETDYYWHVRATNNGSDFGNWSSTWKFTTKADLSAGTSDDISQDINIYPNPAYDFFVLNVSNELIGLPFVFFDENGRVIYKGIIMHEEMQMQIDFIQSGNYYLQIDEMSPILVQKR